MLVCWHDFLKTLVEITHDSESWLVLWVSNTCHPTTFFPFLRGNFGFINYCYFFATPCLLIDTCILLLLDYSDDCIYWFPIPNGEFSTLFSSCCPMKQKYIFLSFLIDNFIRSVVIIYVIMSQYAVSDDPFNKLLYTTLSFWFNNWSFAY